MKLFTPLSLSIALRYALTRKAHRFAFFVAMLSALGIAVGVCALITVLSVMQGLQERLKDAVLDTTAQVVVQIKDDQDLSTLTALPGVTALMPYLEGRVLLQTPEGLKLALLQGYDAGRLQLTAAGAEFKSALPLPPQSGSYAVWVPPMFMLENGLRPGDKIRLISTRNARYTPLGITPSQRLFTIAGGADITWRGGADIITLIGSLDDVSRLLRERQQYVRLFLSDPFLIDQTAAALTQQGFAFTDWRASQGDFFRAVALEKLSMLVMLCLIILVASFNILAALTMLVSARLREIAVLKSLGCTSRQILSIFMLQGLFCAGAGIMTGTALGIPLTLNIQGVLSLLGINIVNGSLPVVISPLQIGAIALCCLLLAALCSLYPALKAARCDPALHLSEI